MQTVSSSISAIGRRSFALHTLSGRKSNAYRLELAYNSGIEQAGSSNGTLCADFSNQTSRCRVRHQRDRLLRFVAGDGTLDGVVDLQHDSAGQPKNSANRRTAGVRREVKVREVRIPIDRTMLDGSLSVPQGARGTVLFAHGSGSSRHSPRNRFVAGVLQNAGFATLLMDLLTADEEVLDERTAALRFDIDLLARRLIGTTWWLQAQLETAKLPIGYFGASTGAAAALVAAADVTDLVSAVVSRGGRPDLAGDVLHKVIAPTLLIVGGNDTEVMELNRKALQLIPAEKKLEIVPGASHLFEEPGALDSVAEFAKNWFDIHIKGTGEKREAA
jgi:putative phosphoribosyl transferase